MKEQLGYVFLYIAAFGFSDYIVECFKLRGIYYILFYTVILVIAVYLLDFSSYNSKREKHE